PAWAATERSVYRSSVQPSSVGFTGITRSGRATDGRAALPLLVTSGSARGLSRRGAGEPDELRVVGDEADVDLGADRDHVVLPARRDERAVRLVDRVVGDVDADTLDLAPDRLGPVAADGDRAVRGVRGVARAVDQIGRASGREGRRLW